MGSRVAGLNAQENSACRSTLGWGAPGSLVVRARAKPSVTGLRFLRPGLHHTVAAQARSP